MADNNPSGSIAPLLIGGLAALVVGTLWLDTAFGEYDLDPEPEVKDKKPVNKKPANKKKKSTSETQGNWKIDWYAAGQKLVHTKTQTGSLESAVSTARDLVNEARDEWGPENGPKPIRWTIKKKTKLVARGTGKTEKILT